MLGDEVDGGVTPVSLGTLGSSSVPGTETGAARDADDTDDDTLVERLACDSLLSSCQPHVLELTSTIDG